MRKIYKQAKQAVVALAFWLIAYSAVAICIAAPPCSAGHGYSANAATVYDKSAVILAVPVGVPVAKVTGIVYSFDSASAAYVQQSAETIKSDEEKRIDRIYEGIKKRQAADDAVKVASANPYRIQYCSACHSTGNAKGGFDITGQLSAQQASTCIKRIMSDDDSIRMPRVVGHLDQAGNLPPDALGKLIQELNEIIFSGLDQAGAGEKKINVAAVAPAAKPAAVEKPAPAKVEKLEAAIIPLSEKDRNYPIAGWAGDKSFYPMDDEGLFTRGDGKVYTFNGKEYRFLHDIAKLPSTTAKPPLARPIPQPPAANKLKAIDPAELKAAK